MGTRMEKYQKKKSNKNRRKLKTTTLIFLTMFLILELNMLDIRLRKSTSTEEKSIYNLSLNQNTVDFELFGNRHQLSRTEITRVLKSLKDRISLVF